MTDTPRPRAPRARLSIVAVAGALMLGAAACGAPINVPLVTERDLPRLHEMANFPHRIYRVEGGDTLQIRYPFHAEMNQDAVVQPDGRITVPEVGDVTVSGLTTREIEVRLVDKTSARLRRPEVSVSVIKFSEKTVYVGGEVGRPGVVSYRRGLTPLQAIMAVGGFRDTARLDSVILVRTGGEEEQFISRRLNLGETVTDGVKEPLYLAPHDVVYVPRTPIADANVWVRQHITELFPFFKGTTLPMTMF
jgi:protein involved in polysaccharide export with SLBB domain